MSFVVKFDLPPALESALRADRVDLAVEVKNAYLLDLYRQGRLSHQDLSEALGLDKFETSAYLKRHNVYEGSLTIEDLEEQRRISDEVMARFPK